ncbi:MAG TPA: cystathionine beta-lyase [Cyanobacteria bacterium UBA9971]|nr:cystathionine beta-lyase [Cyanobacteria bacterium UBA9971]
MSENNCGKSTKCVHTGTFQDCITKGANTPVYTSTSNGFNCESGNLYYPRYLNMPNHKAVADKICALEEGGEEAIIVSSGMAAISSAMLALLKTGDHVLFSEDLYGGTDYFLKEELEKFGIDYTLASAENLEEFESKIKDNTKFIYFETPSNPLLKIIDIEEIVSIAKKYDIITIIDNTFACPINQNPLKFGVDIVVHSASKYLNGHSDLICGAIITSEKLMKRIRPYVINTGGTLNAQDLYLLERSMKTLNLRMQKHNENAQKLAEYLEKHPLVKKVYYPGLKSHAGHSIAKTQMSGFGGVLSVETTLNKEKTREFISNLKLFQEAGSLAGVESLISLPCETSHAKMSFETRCGLGITDSLMRISAGIEDIEDLIADIKQAFEKI